MSPGKYTMEWNATDEIGNPVASGIYFYNCVVNLSHLGKNATNSQNYLQIVTFN